MSSGTKVLEPLTALPANSSVEDGIYAKVTLRWIPFLFICYICAYLDRANVGFAKLQMASDLRLSDTVYGLGAGIFFLSYFLCEVPSNILMHRVGARRWIARIMLTWGVISGGMFFVRGALSFYTLRFLLGAAEAGFFPGIILYLTYWYPSARRAKMTALFMIAVPIANVIGGLLSGWIMRAFDTAAGLPGWKWLFMLEAVPTVIGGLIVLVYLTDGIRECRWLTEPEKDLLERNIKEDTHTGMKTSLSSAFGDARVWLLAVMYFLLNIGLYGLIYWMPTIIKAMGYKDTLQIGLMSAIPYSVAVVAMILVGRSADQHREWRWHLAISAGIGGLGLLFGTLYSGNTMAAMVGLSIGIAGLLASLPTFWCLPSAFLGGVAAAAGIAMINAIGSLSGFVGPSFVGWMKDLTHSSNGAMYAFAFLGILGGILVFLIPARLVKK
ncbi:MAG: MFS transporter [Holophaga sp.]|nr:MFS transporter [Holophaga sp.]